MPVISVYSEILVGVLASLASVLVMYLRARAQTELNHVKADEVEADKETTFLDLVNSLHTKHEKLEERYGVLRTKLDTTQEALIAVQGQLAIEMGKTGQLVGMQSKIEQQARELAEVRAQLDKMVIENRQVKEQHALVEARLQDAITERNIATAELRGIKFIIESMVKKDANPEIPPTAVGGL